MTVILDEWVSTNPEDRKITFVHTASSPAENMVTEYIGKVEKLIKQKGYSIDEKLFNPKKLSDNSAIRMYDLANLGIDRAVFFIRDSCKQTTSLANISSAMEIPTDIVKG
jgi:hypothetical protein